MRSVIALMGIVTSVQLSAHAELITYTDRGVFESAGLGHIVEDFQAIAPQVVPESGGTVDTPGFRLEFDRNHGRLGIEQQFQERLVFADVHRPRIPQSARSPEYVRVVFDTPVYSFGADFESAFSGRGFSFLDTKIQFGTHIVEIPYSVRVNGGFFGLRLSEETPATVVEFTTSDPSSTFLFDNVTYSEVPEPSTLCSLSMLVAISMRAPRRQSRE